MITNGTANDDKINVVTSGSSIVVKGLAAQVTVSGAEPLNDSLVVNGGAGNDTIDASKLHAGQVNLTLNGGDGDDKIIGSAGNDVVNGGKGSDVALLGAGNDVFVWNPGDGSDIVEGQAGVDTLQFNGANLDEKFDISANGSRVRMTRDIGVVTMDLNSTSKRSMSMPWAVPTPSRSTISPEPIPARSTSTWRNQRCTRCRRGYGRDQCHRRQ